MAAFGRAGLSRAGVGGFGAGLIAVAVALIVVAAEAPIHDTWGEGISENEDRSRLDAALHDERAWLALALNLSWSGALQETGDPLVRARMAGDALLQALERRYPREEAGVGRLLENATVSLPDGDFDLLPPEIELRLGGTLVAEVGEAAATVTVDVAAADPGAPRSRAFLERALFEQANDPRSAATGQLRAALSSAATLPSSTGPALDGLVAAALARAAGELSLQLAGAPQGQEGPPGEPPPAPPPPSDSETLLALADAAASQVCAFLEQAAAGQGALAGALLRALACTSGAWLDAATAALASDLSRFKGLVSAVLALVNLSLGDAMRAVLDASRAFAWAAANATARAAAALLSLAPSSVRNPVPDQRVAVSLEGRGASLSLRMAPGEPGGPLALARVALAALNFTLSSRARAFENGRWVEARFEGPAHFEFPIALRAGMSASALARANGTAEVSLSVASRAEPFAETVGWLESVRREVDRRALSFGDAVSSRLAQSAASALTRLAFRLFEGLADGNQSRAAKALFELMERYFAEDLRAALVVNFTVLGVNLTLRPDPVGQQVSLEHTEGPHTFGVRVRRVFDPDNPLRGKFEGDPLSLALEVYWRYELPPVLALLTLDPFLRTDEGLVRFDLRVREGDGLALSLAAPRILRRAGTLELALSDFIPGGVPLALTPSGGEISFDAGARVEFARVPLASEWRMLVRAVADALLDSMANQTVQEVWDLQSAKALSRAFLERLVGRLADTFAALASRFVLRADFFVRFRWAEALGAAAAEVEFSLAVLEPVLVMAAEAGAAAQLVAAAMAGAAPRPPPALSPVDWLPTFVHERVGFSARLRLFAGVPFLDRILRELPGARFEQALFMSLGAIASAAGRRSLHWVTEFTLGFEGMVAQSAAMKLLGAYRGDGIEAAHLRVESLAGPRVLISEVMPAPVGDDEDLEFIELYNPGFVEEDLTGWTLTDDGGHAFRLPDGTRIGAGRTLVIARSALPFFLRFGVASDVPTLTLALNDDNDRVRLANARGWVSDEVEWGVGSLRGRTIPPDASLARRETSRPQVDLPGSSLRFTGTWEDFAEAHASPGAT